MSEQPKCPKCGGTNAKTHINPRGQKIGKCPDCKFFGSFGKPSKEEIDAAKQARRAKKTARPKGKATATGNRRPSPSAATDGAAGRGMAKPVKQPIPYQPPTAKQRRWYDDFLDLLD